MRFRCCYHLEPRIARIPSKVKHQFVGSCQLSVRVIFDSVCQLWGCRRAAASAAGRQTKPTMGRPGPPANESRASRSPDPRKGPGERGAGRRRRPAARAAARAPGGAEEPPEANRREPQRAQRAEGNGDEGRSPSPGGPAAAHPGGQAQTRRTGSEGRSSGPQPGGPEPGGGRKGPKGPGGAQGPPGRQSGEGRNADRAGGCARAATTGASRRGPARGTRGPRLRWARAAAAGADRVRRAATRSPRAPTALMAAADPRKARPGPTECRPRKTGRPREGHPHELRRRGVSGADVGHHRSGQHAVRASLVLGTLHDKGCPDSIG